MQTPKAARIPICSSLPLSIATTDQQVVRETTGCFGSNKWLAVSVLTGASSSSSSSSSSGSRSSSSSDSDDKQILSWDDKQVKSRPQLRFGGPAVAIPVAATPAAASPAVSPNVAPPSAPASVDNISLPAGVDIGLPALKRILQIIVAEQETADKAVTDAVKKSEERKQAMAEIARLVLQQQRQKQQNQSDAEHAHHKSASSKYSASELWGFLARAYKLFQAEQAKEAAGKIAAEKIAADKVAADQAAKLVADLAAKNSSRVQAPRPATVVEIRIF